MSAIESWLCDLHRVRTLSDCPACDAEQIADLERETAATCHKCRRDLRVGKAVWASDWTVIEPGGLRAETRYTCDDCEATA